MWKEITIISVILIIVIGGDIFTHNYTKKSVEMMHEQIDDLTTDLINNIDNEELVESKYNNILSLWEDRFKVLAFYLEHDELEKIKTELVALKANLDVGEYEKGVEELEKCKYILEHVQEKEQFSLMNVL